MNAQKRPTTHVEAKVRSLKDQDLWSGVEHYSLISGEVFVGTFKSQCTLDGLISIGCLEVVDEATPCQKVFPVIPLGHLCPVALQVELGGPELPLSDMFEDRYSSVQE